MREPGLPAVPRREEKNSTHREENDRRSGWEDFAVGRGRERQGLAVAGDGRVHEDEPGTRVEGVAREAQVHERHCGAEVNPGAERKLDR